MKVRTKTSMLTKRAAISEGNVKDYLTIEERRTLNENRNVSNIIIVKVDEDGTIVLINRDECLKRIEEEPNNNETHNQVRNQIIEMRTDIAELTDGLYKNGIHLHKDLVLIRGQLFDNYVLKRLRYVDEILIITGTDGTKSRQTYVN